MHCTALSLCRQLCVQVWMLVSAAMLLQLPSLMAAAAGFIRCYSYCLDLLLPTEMGTTFRKQRTLN